MQLVIAGVIFTKVGAIVVEVHNRLWRDVKKAIRQTREFKEREWAAEAVEHALTVMEKLS